jgi:periplasmic divalent cation tolerance protein
VPSDHFVVVLTTFPADRDAERLARTLVEERLAACVNVLPPMRSIYTWQGAIETAEERQLLIKTSANRVPELESRLKALHPYDVPEFIVLPITTGSAAYLTWIGESTSRP